MKYPFFFTLVCGVTSLYAAENLESRIKRLETEQQSVAALLQANRLMPGKENYRPLGDLIGAVEGRLTALEERLQPLLEASSEQNLQMDPQQLADVVFIRVMEQLKAQSMGNLGARTNFLAGNLSAQALAERNSFRKDVGGFAVAQLVQDTAFMEQVARGLIKYFKLQKTGGNRDLHEEVAQALADNSHFMKELSETALGRMFGGDLSDEALEELGQDPADISLEKMTGDSESIVTRRRASSASRRMQHNHSAMTQLAFLLSHNELFLKRVASQTVLVDFKELKQRLDELELDRNTQAASIEGWLERMQEVEKYIDTQMNDIRCQMQTLDERKRSPKKPKNQLINTVL